MPSPTAHIRCRHTDGSLQPFPDTVRAVFDGSVDANEHEVFLDEETSGEAPGSEGPIEPTGDDLDEVRRHYRLEAP